jgi:hypothetical protein
MEFAENEYFENSFLEKRFWWRRSRDGWGGLVSEPVGIRWKKGKDLTGGLLDLVVRAWEEGKSQEQDDKKVTGMTESQRVLKKKIDHTGMGGLSFFAWFGFIGRRVSAQESAEANAQEAERRERRRKGENVEVSVDEDLEDDGEDEDELDMSLEIFPDGDELAMAISEDLWPGAIKYFSMFFVTKSLQTVMLINHSTSTRAGRVIRC